jgi:hypothetical protein
VPERRFAYWRGCNVASVLPRCRRFGEVTDGDVEACRVMKRTTNAKSAFVVPEPVVGCF